MTSNTLYIIAGSIEEYLDWVYKFNTKYPTQNFYYVIMPEDFKYTYNPEGIFIGTWYEREDAWELIQKLVEVSPLPEKQKKFSEILQIYLQKKNR